MKERSVAPDWRSGSSPETTHVLTLNTGSSSLKAAVYAADEGVALLVSATVDRIGASQSQVRIVAAGGHMLLDETRELPTHGAAVQLLMDWLATHGQRDHIAAVGHRVVHGGMHFSDPQPVTPALLSTLRTLVKLDPNHMPQAIETIEHATRMFPTTLQVACFDTAFHRHMPHVAQMYALPQRFEAEGVVRYGFHGLSYEFIMRQLQTLEPQRVNDRVIIAHLGNGASMAAVSEGHCIDTTMGFTPTGGLVMGTRTGDLDPGVLLYLLHERGMTPDEINTLVNQESGLLGVSGISADMRDLLQRESTDPNAAAAVELFCYSVQRSLGALAAVLGGLDCLVFTGGIGEHAAAVRARASARLGFLGITLDDARNTNHEPVISSADSRVVVRVINTDEDAMIATHTIAVLHEQGDGNVHI